MCGESVVSQSRLAAVRFPQMRAVKDRQRADGGPEYRLPGSDILEQGEINIMKPMHRYFGPLLLAAAVVSPLLIATVANAQEATVQVRVYDRNHKDYHNWDDREDRSYRNYLSEQHKDYREYNKQNRKEQDHYWNWRHSHPDHD
jgi:hypothetical protein